jgi:hypothetical protein
MKNVTERWRDIDGYEGRYRVSDLGRVESVGRDVQNQYGSYFRPGRMMARTVVRGYAYANLCMDAISAPREIGVLVLTEFEGSRPSKSHEAHHADGDNSNNALDNLSWRPRPLNTVRHAPGRTWSLLPMRAEARAQGLKFYFTGKPCRHGHVAERYIGGMCTVCVQLRNRRRPA